MADNISQNNNNTQSSPPFNSSFFNGPSDVVNTNMPGTSPKVVSREIPLTDLKEKELTSQFVDYVTGQGVDPLISQPTALAKELPEIPAASGPTLGTGDMGRDLANIENKPIQTAKELETDALVVIEIVDWLLSGGMQALAQDTAPSAWELTDIKKQKLAYYLSLVMYKYQSKVKIEFLFLGLLFGAYFHKVRRAVNMWLERRKRLKEEKEKAFLETKGGERQKAIRSEMLRRIEDATIYSETSNAPINNGNGSPYPQQPIMQPVRTPSQPPQPLHHQQPIMQPQARPVVVPNPSSVTPIMNNPIISQEAVSAPQIAEPIPQNIFIADTKEQIPVLPQEAIIEQIPDTPKTTLAEIMSIDKVKEELKYVPVEIVGDPIQTKRNIGRRTETGRGRGRPRKNA